MRRSCSFFLIIAVLFIGFGNEAWSGTILPTDHASALSGDSFVSDLVSPWIGPAPAVLSKSGSISGHIRVPIPPDGSILPALVEAWRLNEVSNPDSVQIEEVFGPFPVDPDGRYSLPDLTDGTYVVYAWADGFGAGFYENAPTLALAKRIEVAAGQEIQGIDFALEPVSGGSAQISGKVTDRDSGLPVPGARVQAYLDSGSLFVVHAPTDSDGNYSLEGLPEGAYRIVADARGYVQGWYENAQVRSDAIPVPVADGEVVEGIDISLHRGGSIEGLVTDADGNPLVDVYVQPWERSTTDSGALSFLGASTDPDGRYRIDGLAPGSYRIGAQYSNPWFNSYQWFDQVSSLDRATPIVIAGSETVSEVNFQFKTPAGFGSVSGNVSFSDGTPFTQDRGSLAFVRLENITFSTDSVVVQPHLPEGVVHPDGTWLIEGVPEGRYLAVLTAIDAAGQYAYRFWYENVFSREDATPFNVFADTRTEGIDFELPSVSGKISGLVTDADGRPWQRASVSLEPTGTGSFGSWKRTVTDSLGRFSFDRISDGNYRVSAFACSGFACIQRWYLDAQTADTATPIVVAGGQSSPERVEIVLPLDRGTASISGTVRLLNGNPLGRTWIVVSSRANQEGGPSFVTHTETDDLGRYSVSMLPAGSYIVQASFWAPDGSQAEQWFRNAQTYEAATPVVLTRGERRTGIDFVLDPKPWFGRVIGSLTHAETGQAPRNALVELLPRAFDLIMAPIPLQSLYARTDSEGRFTFDQIRRGDYYLRAWVDGAMVWYPGVTSRADARLIRVVGGETTVADFSYRPNSAGTGSISGKVLGDEIDFLDVAVVRATEQSSGGSVVAVLDQFGTYQVSGLAPGNYTLYAFAPYMVGEFYDDTYDATKATPVRVEEGMETAGIDFSLASPRWLYLPADSTAGLGPRSGASDAVSGAVSIAGRVTSSGNVPVANASIVLMDAEEVPVVSSVTDDSGNFVLTAVPADSRYRILVSAPGFKSAWHDGTQTAESALPLILSGQNVNLEVVLDRQSITSVEADAELPAKVTLSGNYPNPFNPVTTIGFGLPKASHVELTVYDILGKEVGRLVSGQREPGWHTVSFNATGLPSGVYVVQIQSSGQVVTRTMNLVK